MASLRLLWCFLLLALAALCPSIAMSTDDPAEGREDSSSGRTRVIVYLCKECESSICQSRPFSFENFEKIAETENRRFSNGIIELVTREKDIIMCFQERNYLPEGIFGISWVKAEGVGYSCGSLKSGEHGRGSSSIEEKKTCCKTETDVWKHNPTLKCYTQKSHPEPTTPPADVPDEGNPGKPNCPDSQNISLSISVAFLSGVVLIKCVIGGLCFWQKLCKALRLLGWWPPSQGSPAHARREDTQAPEQVPLN